MTRVLIADDQPLELDALNRPRAFYGSTVHQGCTRSQGCHSPPGCTL